MQSSGVAKVVMQHLSLDILGDSALILCFRLRCQKLQIMFSATYSAPCFVILISKETLLVVFHTNTSVIVCWILSYTLNTSLKTAENDRFLRFRVKRFRDPWKTGPVYKVDIQHNFQGSIQISVTTFSKLFSTFPCALNALFFGHFFMKSIMQSSRGIQHTIQRIISKLSLSLSTSYLATSLPYQVN